jgi:hypothetical protein
MAREADTSKDTNLDDYYCNAAYKFQTMMGITLTGDYPLARFNILLEEALKENEKESDKYGRPT